jgi:hypothetical protein
MSKSHLNLLVQISKALVNSKIQFLIQKSFFFAFGPANLTGPLSLWPTGPVGPSPLHRPKPSSPAHLARASVASLRKYIFHFGSRLPSWSLLSRLTVKSALAVSSVFHPAPADPGRVTTEFHHDARSAPRDAAQAITAPPSLPLPLNPPLNLTPVFNGVKTINAVVTPATPLRCPPGPHKSPRRPPEHPIPSPSSSLLLFEPERLPTEPHRPPPCCRDAWPPHCRPCPGEPPTELPAFHSSSPAPWPAPVDTGGRSSGEPGAAIHGRSIVDRGWAWSMVLWT